MKKIIVYPHAGPNRAQPMDLAVVSGGAPPLRRTKGYDGTPPKNLHYQYSKGTQSGGPKYVSTGTSTGTGSGHRDAGTQTNGGTPPPTYSNITSPVDGPRDGFAGYRPGGWG